MIRRLMKFKKLNELNYAKRNLNDAIVAFAALLFHRYYPRWKFSDVERNR